MLRDFCPEVDLEPQTLEPRQPKALNEPETPTLNCSLILPRAPATQIVGWTQ